VIDMVVVVVVVVVTVGMVANSQFIQINNS